MNDEIKCPFGYGICSVPDIWCEFWMGNVCELEEAWWLENDKEKD